MYGMTHKFRIQLPMTAKEAFRIDKKVGNDYWEKALNKEMSNAKVAREWVNVVTPDQEK